MDSPNISVRIRRHESLPRYGLHGTHAHSTAKTASKRPTTSNRAFTDASVLIGRRLGATKNNPYVGSFRHSPPTSLRSMAASSLPSLSSMKEAASPSFSLVPSFALAASSPYVGWFRHAPPVFSSHQYLGSSTTKNKTRSKRERTKPQKKPSIVQHKVNLNCLLELDRWHHQLTSLLMRSRNDDTGKNAPLLLRRIINGRLLGGSGKDDRLLVRGSSIENSIIHRCNSIYQPNPSGMQSATVLSRLTSWLLFPRMYADDECYDDYGCFNGNYESKRINTGLKFTLPAPKDNRSIEIDSDESDEDYDSSSASSSDYDPDGESSVNNGLTLETEREFSEEANLSVSEIAEAYYAHQLLDERRRRSNSDTTTTSQQSGLSPTPLHHATDFTGEEEIRQRLDYEITQMDIARMTRNASRHLDVDSIVNLPTIVYREKPASPSPSPPNTTRNKLTIPQYEESFVCTPIHEDSKANDKSILSEDGWSFMMVSHTKSTDNSVNLTGASEKDSAKGSYGTDEMCVICQQPFREGDRLRVLPCNHSFHVGCIDRWLCGSHSHNECFTAGCPTCKKRPYMQSSSSSLQVPALESTEKDETSMSGSVPSWAFANLGNAMAMSSGNFSVGN